MGTQNLKSTHNSWFTDQQYNHYLYELNYNEIMITLQNSNILQLNL